MVDLLAKLDEIEKLIRPSASREEIGCASVLALRIARASPSGPVSNLAMRLMSTLGNADPKSLHEGPAGAELRKLRAAIVEAASAPAGD